MEPTKGTKNTFTAELGGTFLGGLEIYKYTGFEGYELATYVGAIIGALLATLLGVKLALRIARSLFTY
jgi:outer membrane lipoprotein SlyB